MDPIGIFLVLALVVIAVVIIRNNTGKRGAEKKSAEAAKLSEKNSKLAAIGLSATTGAKKLGHFLIAIAIFLVLGVIFGVQNVATGGAPSNVFAFLLFGGLIGFGLAIFGLWIADAAENKGRSWVAFFWLSVLINPIIIGIVVAVLAPLPVPRASSVATSDKQQNPDVVDQIKRLSELKEQGHLTEEEFEVKKKDLLDRL